MQDPNVKPRGPQFGMRSLLAFVTACCLLLALPGFMGEVWALAVAWFVLLIVAHVAANAWGSRLRGRGGHADASIVELPPAPPSRLEFAPPTRLRQRTALSWLRFAASGLCASLGGTLALYLMALLSWQRIGYGSVAIAGVSAAVIGGFVGFLASSFLEEALRTWREATLASRQDQRG